MADRGALEISFDWRGQRYQDASRGLQAVAAHLGRNFDNVASIITPELRGWLEDIAEALAERHGTPWPGGTTAKTLSRRSGFMIESIKQSVKVTGGTVDTIVGHISVPYERKIHENGGVLRATRAKYLTIPLPAALDSRGIPLKKSAREWANTFVIKSKAGNLLIVQKQGSRIVPLYVLKSQVYIPPRLGMKATLEAGMTMLADRLATAILKDFVGV